MFYAILYLENSDKYRFADLKKFVENYYVPNKADYPKTVTIVQSLPLNYKIDYNSNRNYQSNVVSNQIRFAQHGKNEDDEGDRK